jgi:hypothetical protein
MRYCLPLLRAGWRGFGLSLALFSATLAVSAAAQKLAPPEGLPAQDEFSRLVQLAPFKVQGQQLAVSIHARNSRDRRYAAQFAEDVLRVIHESGVSERTGKGLVIIGQKGEPHPIVFFRRFLGLAEAGKLDPGIAALAPGLKERLENWEGLVNNETRPGRARDAEEDLEFERIVTALPLSLEGAGAKIYQLAWAAKFDDAAVETRLRSLTPADLERRDLFARFDWVFYLPPKNAFDRVLDEIVADELKEEDVGFAERLAVKGAMLVIKPKIRKTIEAVSGGLMLHCIAQAAAGLTPDEAGDLAGAYIEELMPFEKHRFTGTDHARAVQAVRAELKQLQGRAHAVAADPDAEEPAGPGN